MSILIKTAQTEKEIDDALWVRHEVFVLEDGRFGGSPLPGERLIDRFDVFPGGFHVIAYDGSEPIATIRLNKESSLGLPADRHFDFSSYRAEADAELEAEWIKGTNSKSNGKPPNDSNGQVGMLLSARLRFGKRVEDRPRKAVLGSAGMLAVRKKWRRRRDVIRAMYKVAAGVCASTGTTHIVAVVNEKTKRMYHRLGFTTLSKPFWSDEIGDNIVAIASTSAGFYNWAFGDFPDSPLGEFRDSFERLFVRAGDSIFRQDDIGEYAYIVAEGSVDITKHGSNGEELTLANLGRGEMFGELALIDRGRRSASAVASSDTELIALTHDAFMSNLASDPLQIDRVLTMFSERLRSMDELIMVHVYSPERQRLEFALTEARIRSIPNRQSSGLTTFHGGPSAIASRAAVDVVAAREFLEEYRDKGELEFSNRQIRFRLVDPVST